MNAGETETRTIKLGGISTAIDLVVECSALSAASLAAELVIRATALPDFRVQRSGDDSSPAFRFMVAHFADGLAFVAEFYLDGDRLLACYASSPEDWSASQRATACARIFEPLFSAVRTNDHQRVTITTIPLT